MKRWVVVVGVLLAGCSSAAPAPEFSLSGATVDATHWCPGGAVEAKYDVHATVQARTRTSRVVTVEAASAEMVRASVTGPWLEKVGSRYDAAAVKVSPTTIPAGSTSALDVAIPSACTSGRYESSQSSSGSYTVTIHMATSAGAFTVKAQNRHEILAA